MSNSDALNRAVLSGVAPGLDALSVSRRIVRRAVAVQMGKCDGVPGARHTCTASVEAAGPPEIIVRLLFTAVTGAVARAPILFVALAEFRGSFKGLLLISSATLTVNALLFATLARYTADDIGDELAVESPTASRTA